MLDLIKSVLVALIDKLDIFVFILILLVLGYLNEDYVLRILGVL